MKQKFGMLKFVKVCKEMPVSMQHFESDFVAIVDGTYSQKYGGNMTTQQYSVYRIQDGKVVGTIAWYNEDQLTLCDEQDYGKAIKMVEDYKTYRQNNYGY